MTEQPLASLLDYLAEVGYGEVYLNSAGNSAGEADGRTGQTAPAGGQRAAAEPTSRGAEPSAGETAEAQAHASLSDRAAALAALAGEARSCQRCRLCEKRQTVVFGSGNVGAELMFIGEGPGAQEDRQGLPFVGPAGALLTKIIAAIDLTRDEVYIANIVKCRPPGNRDPRPDEVVACRGYLEKQIEWVAPKVIVALGRVAAQTLLGNDFSLGRMRNQWYQLHGVDLLVTYHPAALLRNSGYKRPTWEDMQKVRDRLRGTG